MSHDAYAFLAVSLPHLLERIDAMYQTLLSEEQALRQRDLDALAQSTKEKERLTHEIHAITTEQDRLLKASGLPQGRAGVDQALGRLPKDLPQANSLRTAWAAIIERSERCNRQNEQNGAYIGLLAAHTQRSIDALHGGSGATLVYGPDGASRRQGGSRKLISV